MSKLKIPSRFVPAEINEKNLSNYRTYELDEIEQTYQGIKREKLKKAVKTGPAITAIFGSHGTGVRTLMKTLQEETRIHNPQAGTPITINAERFITAIPSFIDYVAGGGDRGEAIERYLPAGKYMHDRLMEEALDAGYPVSIAKRGRTKGGIELLKSFNKTDIPVHTILYQAPLKVKLGAVHEGGDIQVSAEDIKAEHHAMTSIMMSLAEQSTNLMSIYFRTPKAEKDNSVITEVHAIAGRDSDSFSVYDAELAAAFDTYFAPQGISVEKLLKTDEQKVMRQQNERIVRGFHCALA
jgi:hypothetical protein